MENCAEKEKVYVVTYESVPPPYRWHVWGVFAERVKAEISASVCRKEFQALVTEHMIIR